MIQEAYCSYEVSKLLKEKGFGEECSYRYIAEPDYKTLEFVCSPIGNGSKYLYNAPTQQMAMAWLREVHGIFIGISLCERYENKTDNDTTIMFFFELLNLKEKQLINGISQEYTHTYEEACEAAIKYCLENLI